MAVTSHLTISGPPTSHLRHVSALVSSLFNLHLHLRSCILRPRLRVTYLAYIVVYPSAVVSPALVSLHAVVDLSTSYPSLLRVPLRPPPALSPPPLATTLLPSSSLTHRHLSSVINVYRGDFGPVSTRNNKDGRK
ncbi:hypothetical protein K440DRAFT_424373 [Wilcoxina mikolae CBS 423.85]|nr:hypothetical protein K440DRAFT_424373 [Wilcoxina mikolae CBS 423.85]